MSYTPEQLLEILSKYEKLSANSLLKNAKGKDKKKSVPKAKVDSKKSTTEKSDDKKKPSDKKKKSAERKSILARFAGLPPMPKTPSWIQPPPKKEQVQWSKEQWAEHEKHKIPAVHPNHKTHHKEEGKRCAFCDRKLPAHQALKGYDKCDGCMDRLERGVDIGDRSYAKAVSVSDSLLQKYSEEGQTIDRLVAKYGQSWNPFAKQNPFRGISGETLAQTHADDLDQLHRSQQITDAQYNDAYKALHGTYPPEAAAKQDAEKAKNMQMGEGGKLNLEAPLDPNGQSIDPNAQNQSVMPNQSVNPNSTLNPIPTTPSPSKAPNGGGKSNPYGVDTKKLQLALYNNSTGEAQGVLSKGSKNPKGVDGDWGQQSEQALELYRQLSNLPSKQEAVKKLLSGGKHHPAKGQGQAPMNQFEIQANTLVDNLNYTLRGLQEAGARKAIQPKDYKQYYQHLSQVFGPQIGNLMTILPKNTTNQELIKKVTAAQDNLSKWLEWLSNQQKLAT